MIKIEIQSVDVIEKEGQRGPYFKQAGYAFLLGRDGKPEPYPRQFLFILAKDERGNPIAYQPGFYQLSPQSIRIGRYSDLEIGFPVFTKLVQGTGKVKAA